MFLVLSKCVELVTSTLLPFIVSIKLKEDSDESLKTHDIATKLY